jgi:hypothetical protein
MASKEAFRNMFRPKPQKKCWCGSGKKEKNCHPRGKQRVAQPAGGVPAMAAGPTASIPPHVTKSPSLVKPPWGFPGEEHKIWVVPILKGEENKPHSLAGNEGKYKVQLLLSRPGHPMGKEREFSFIDNLVGTSHVRIAKPESERGEHDVAKLRLGLHGKNYFITAETDKDGFIGKFVAELNAKDMNGAEDEVYGSLAPFLSAWSMNADIPINIETIQITELATTMSSLRVMTPHFDMNLPGAPPPFFLDEFCQYASIYREGLNTNSIFYRFLCFYKIIESLIAKRGKQAKALKEAGKDPRQNYETIPAGEKERLELLGMLYPWRSSWDSMALEQVFPKEVYGLKATAIRDRHLRPLRLGIAHALLDQGEITVVIDKMEYIKAVNKWLPLCRLLARWMLRMNFPRECSLAMK